MNTRITIWPLLLGALLLAGRGQDLAAQHRLVALPESRLWIEGTSTLDAFACQSEAVEGYADLETGRPSAVRASSGPAARAEVTVAVSTFDCGKERMNRDFYKALGAEAHPVIRFDLDRAAVQPASGEAEAAYMLRLTGRLTIAGTARRIAMTMQGRRLADGRYHVQGSQALLMSDFGITPPTALLGLIRTRDRILVHVDLVAAQPSASTHTTHSTQ